MGDNWAIAVGISQYINMASLPYCKQDATAIAGFLEKTAGFKRVYLLTDDSPDITLDEGVTIPAQPTLTNLKRFFQVRFATPFLKSEDTLWVFFFGHGFHFSSQDYLMPSDALRNEVATTGIALESVVESLKRCGTRRIVLVLDACYSKEQGFGQGFGPDPKDAIVLFASDFDQTSQSIDDIRQGAFAHAFLASLKLLGQYPNATLEHLYLYLRDTLTKFNLQYGKPPQAPRLHAEAPLSAATIAIPQIAVRKNLAQRLLPLQTKPSLEKLSTSAPLTQTSYSPLLKAGAIGFIFIGLAAGLMSLVNYQDAQRRADSVSQGSAQKLSPGKSASVSTAPKPIAPVANPPDAAAGDDTLKRVPKTGTYYASGAELSASRREIARIGDRFCIKVVNGTSATAAGYKPLVLVSSLSRQQDSVYIDGTGENLRPDESFSEFTDGKSIWQWLKDSVDRTGVMAECLARQDKFTRQLPPEN
jgi:hypothetical protein